MQRYFFEGSLSPGALVTLSPEESHHIAKVLRYESNDPILLITGKGEVANATLISVHPKKCVAKVIDVRREGASSQVILAVGICKGPALDFIVRRSTELGVLAIQPLVTRHSLAVSAWNEGRWGRVVVEVSKQCEASFFPELLPAKDLRVWLESRSKDRALVLCHEKVRGADPKSDSWKAGVDLAIGPEGGWSEEETTWFESHHAIQLGLGKHRLRAETAALVGLTLVKKMAGEFALAHSIIVD
jgi:16S rRNA (uracil1498-N3)-methyltransferase